MSAARKATTRSLFAPEVIQTSKMDCGPAALKCLLEGFGIDVGYGRLREACQTDVDGTSIDVIEDLAVQLGLAAEQTMVPADHVLMPAATTLPALVVIALPNMTTHFVVIWRQHGSLFQIMDPAVGRRWVSDTELLAELFRHTMRLPETGVREWASSDKFLGPLDRRLAFLGLRAPARERLVAFACADATCQRLGALDAGTRLVDQLVRSGGLPRGGRLESLLERLAGSTKESGSVPESFWSFWPAAAAAAAAAAAGSDASDDADEPEAFLRGAVLVSLQKPSPHGDAEAREAVTELRPEVRRALHEPVESPWLPLLRLVRTDGLLAPGAVALTLLFAGAAVSFQALVLRGLLELGRSLGTGGQRLGAMIATVVLLTAIVLLSGAVSAGILRIGRRLEVRLRVALFQKVPRIGDQFFQSRLVSDMAERAHALAGIRALPKLGFGLLGTMFQLLFTIVGVVWHEPSSAVPVLGVAALSVVGGWFSQPMMTERELRVRGHNAALGRYYLDALMGTWCISAHGAGPAVMREQEAQLVQWGDAQVRLQRLAVLIEGCQTLMGYALAAWLLFHLHTGKEGHALLLAYWALQLPLLGQSFVVFARQVPMQRNIAERVLEPLSTPEEARSEEPCEAIATATFETAGPRISMRDVTVRAGGIALLEHLDLEIAPGSHVAIVGESGAGKSTLVGLLLGWHRPAAGEILVDERPLTDAAVQRLRRQTAWVDPAVQLWNERFVDNLTYAVGPASTPSDLGWAVRAADLQKVLERLPDGLQAPLGEGGALVSGGEGQRVRLGRAMMQRGVRLAVLDEPFRGLDRAQRGALLRRSRELWSSATLLCATHDVAETLQFDRVLVVGSGKILEDGDPATLAAAGDSLYAQLLAAERALTSSAWTDEAWRRIRVERGHLTELAMAGDG